MQTRTMRPIYDVRPVFAHGNNPGPSVFLMNEAPGPSEAASGIPSFGQQGANIYHALRSARISWAVAHPQFVWPKNGAFQQSKRHLAKAAFLSTRAQYITCTNAFHRWPKPYTTSDGFCVPSDDDVLSDGNILRVKSEIASSHRVILVCGRSAYLACLGKNLPHPSSRERTRLNALEIQALNERLESQFEVGWYMGHTRRWFMKSHETAQTLMLVAQFAGWQLEHNN